MANSITEKALQDLNAEIQQKKLPPLIQRKFVNMTDEEGETVRVMQWNMLAYGNFWY